jgi:hypothetical protein
MAVIMNITTDGVLHFGLLFDSLHFHQLLFMHSILLLLI